MAGGGFRREMEAGLPPENHVKMSEVLVDFMEPYRDLARTDEDFEKLTALAVLAWNAAILPDVEAKRTLQADRTYRLDADFRELLDTMMERKRKYFANNRRLILSYEVCSSEEDNHLFVVSTLT